MAKLHPTCHKIPLTVATKSIALLEMVLGIIGIVWFVIVLERYDLISLSPFEDPSTDTGNSRIHELDNFSSDGTRKFSAIHKVLGLTMSVLFTLINLSLCVVLLVGVHKEKIGLCLTWFYVRCAVLVFKAIIFPMYLIGGRPVFSLLPYMAFMLVHAYGLWVVNLFVEELREVKVHRKLEAQRRSGSVDSSVVNGIEKIAKKRKETYEFEA